MSSSYNNFVAQIKTKKHMEKNRMVITEYDEKFMKVVYDESRPDKYALIPKGVDVHDTMVKGDLNQLHKSAELIEYYRDNILFVSLIIICDKLEAEGIDMLEDAEYLSKIIYPFNVLLGNKYPIDYQTKRPSLLFRESADFETYKRNYFLAILETFIFSRVDLRVVERDNNGLKGLNKFLRKEFPTEYKAYCTLADTYGFENRLKNIVIKNIRVE